MHFLVLDHLLAQSFPAPGDEIQNARRKARLFENPRHQRAAMGSHTRRLEHYRVSVYQSRSNLPEGNGDREVPGGDDADDSERLAGRVDQRLGVDRRHDFSDTPDPLGSIETQERDAAQSFAARSPAHGR